MLNASNFPGQPIYPYAFIQLRALARRAGLSIRFEELLGVEPSEYGSRIALLLAKHRPRLIGIHLRQADSVVYANYVSDRSAPYYPVEDTEELLAAVRANTDIPVVLGGFGFTTHAPELFARLMPDFGVEGEPDGFFRAFDDVCARRRLVKVENLLFARDGVLQRPKRTFYAPLDEREYDETSLRELEAFYGRSVLYGPDAPSVAVELARGCPYRCYFCTEPGVKGRTERRRNLDAVMGDVEFLVSRGIRRFWMVCSEINLKDSSLALEVADRFSRINAGGRPKIKWHAYHLPRWLSAAELKLLYRSGYAGGWNDFPSLDDENLRQTRVPYRTRHILEHVESTLEMEELEPTSPPRVGLFLGNAFAGEQTFARSLQVFNDAGLAERFASADVAGATRLFSSSNGAERAPGSDRAMTFTRAGRAPHVDVVHPTFYLSPALSNAFSSDLELLEFLGYVGSTLLSSRHLSTKDWYQFLATSASSGWLSAQLSGDWARTLRVRGVPRDVAESVKRILCDVGASPGGQALRSFFADHGASPAVRRSAALLMIHRLSAQPSAKFLELLRYFGIEHDAEGRVTGSSYRVLTALLGRYGSSRELFDDLARRWEVEDDSREAWLMRLMLYSKNIVLRAEYRPFLLPDRPAPAASEFSGAVYGEL